VQDLINASPGLNLGIDFLPGAFGYDADATVAADVGPRLLWLDAFCANVDRTWRNPNLLLWHGHLWAIDHGACLYFHHAWEGGVTQPARFADQPWDPSGHVLLASLPGVARVDVELRGLLDRAVFEEVVELVPEAWLQPVPGATTVAELRTAYVDFLAARLASDRWLPGVAA
jgi:hypothetical protein